MLVTASHCRLVVVHPHVGVQRGPGAWIGEGQRMGVDGGVAAQVVEVVGLHDLHHGLGCGPGGREGKVSLGFVAFLSRRSVVIALRSYYCDFCSFRVFGLSLSRVLGWL
jgi:hypothetical protein